jgi:UDP-glucose:(heptosyl)LPS alpha-1,3-glucosyltransferase
VERIVFECARFLASRGHVVTVLANEWETDDTQASIVYRHVPLRDRPTFLRRASFLRNCTRSLQGIDTDVLNTHGCICPFGGVFRVHSLHRDWLNQSRIRRKTLSQSGIKQRLNPMHPALLRLEAQHFRGRKYRRVIALSVHVRDALNRYYGVPVEDVDILPNGYSPTEFNPEARAARRDVMRGELCLKPDEIAMLFVANELERKGFSTVLNAMGRLNRANLKLLVVGRVDEKLVMQLAGAAGLSDQVMACGPTNNVPNFHAAADLFVLPTQYEAFCLAILEALGSGLPVITSAVPGARDAIVPGANGALVANPDDGEELASALEPYLEREYRNGISENTPGTVAAYQWPELMTRYEEILLRFAV